MIVSHKHRFIFIKTHKTAGTSIEHALSALAGPDAIVTPIFPPEKGHEPRNYSGSWTDTLEWVEANPDGRVRTLARLARNTGGHRTRGFYNHMPAWLVRARVGTETWDSYFKFCFERNPWAKMLSLYDWLTRDLDQRPKFDDWLLEDPRVSSDWPLYAIDGACAVNRIGRYETLNEDLAEILAKIGLSAEDVALPFAKSGARTDNVTYSSQGLAHVARLFRNEIELFGYECPPELCARLT